MSARLPCHPASAPLAACFAFRTTGSFSATAARALLPGSGWTCIQDEEGDSAVTAGVGFV